MRNFDDNGGWNQEALLAFDDDAHKYLNAIFDILEAKGMNPREAGIRINSEVEMTALVRLMNAK